MIPAEQRHPGYFVGKNWFQWAVLLVILGLLAMGIISALNDAKEEVGRQVVDLTVRNMRTGLQLAMGEALMHQREGEIAGWVGSNPVRWLGTAPTGYRGDCSAVEGFGLSGGEWCFAKEPRELVYRPRRIERLQTAGQASPCSDLRWRVVGIKGSNGAERIEGLRIENASACRWME